MIESDKERRLRYFINLVVIVVGFVLWWLLAEWTALPPLPK